jgi:hypothetical protein
MSRRRKSSRAAVSLFSFQDIITSVTAIMILLVLILTLELIERSERKGVAADDLKVASDLRDAVDELEEKAKTLNEELARLQNSAQRSASFSENDIQRLTEEAQLEVIRLTREVDLLDSRQRIAATERRRAEQEVISEQSQGNEVSITDAVALNTRAEEIERANRIELERQTKTHEAIQSKSLTPTLVFNIPDSENLRPRFVDVSKEGLTVLPTKSISAKSFRGLDSTFKQWLASLDKESEYVVVLLRPTGVPLYNKVVDAVKASGLAVGAELIGESMPVTVRNDK